MTANQNTHDTEDAREKKPEWLHEKHDEYAGDDAEAYAEDTPLTWAVGDHPKIRIIAALLSEHDRDINISDLANLAGLNRGTVYQHLDDLRDLGIVKETRKVGNSTMYQINKDSKIVENLGEIEKMAMDRWYDKHAEA